MNTQTATKPVWTSQDGSVKDISTMVTPYLVNISRKLYRTNQINHDINAEMDRRGLTIDQLLTDGDRREKMAADGVCFGCGLSGGLCDCWKGVKGGS